MWDDFVDEFPEVLDVHCYFVNLSDSFEEGVEFTASYGPAYHRYYDTWDFPALRPSVRVPVERYSAAQRAAQQWPSRVAAWWNVHLQPRARRAFQLLEGGAVRTLRDRRLLVLAQKLMPMGDKGVSKVSATKHRKVNSSASPIRKQGSGALTSHGARETVTHAA